MKIIQTITLIIFLLLGLVPYAQGNDNSTYDWMNTSITGLGSVLPRCIESPFFSSIHQMSKTLNAEEEAIWVPTGAYVQQGKMLAMLWNTSGVSMRPQKYRVLYRVDPRFSKPQVFIQKYDYIQQKYISDFHAYEGSILPFYQARPETFSNQRFDDFTNYFNFVARNAIGVQKDDVINITLDADNDFFGADGEMQNGLGVGADPLTIYTDSSGITNKIIYTSGKRWCADIITNADPDFAAKCNAFQDKYVDLDHSALLGKTSEASFASQLLAIPSCPDNSDTPDNNPTCFYDKGRGFRVAVGGVTIKSAPQKFIYSPFTGKFFLYYHADAAGDLNFTTSWPISGMYQGLDQTMQEWNSFATGNDATDIIAFNSYLNNIVAPMNFLHFGVYAMEVEIGKGNNVLSSTDLNNINVQYTILDSGMPDSSSTASDVPQNFRNDAYASGYVWLKVVGTSNMSGNINVTIANYTGSNWFSSIVYGNVIKPLRDKYNELSQIIYRKLIGNAALQNIAKSLLVVYIIIYGLIFLLGAVQISTTDLITRVLKISVIVALFSDTSWTFFNDNLFKVFIEGSDYLLTTVVGVTGSTGNIFGFVDPIFDRYTNGNLWALLAIQLLQIHNGLAFFAIMTVYSILIYFRAILEVIITYCLAFLGIAVMISLAPFFILLILFERTKSLFDNWLSTLFSYMVQPTILLVFFLLIDQMMAEYITETVVKACWGILIPIKIGLDLSNIGIPLSFSFSLPFLPGIPFYVSQVKNIDSAATLISSSGTFIRIASSAFIFLIYSKLAAGLVDYVTLVVQYLTNVLAARQDGKLHQDSTPVKDIMSDMSKLASPITGTVKGIGNFAKEKFIDQKISHRSKVGDSDVDYRKIKKTDDSGEENTEASDKVTTKLSGTSDSSAADTKLLKDGVKTEDSKLRVSNSNKLDKENMSKSSSMVEAEKGVTRQGLGAPVAADTKDLKVNTNEKNSKTQEFSAKTKDGLNSGVQTEATANIQSEEGMFNTSSKASSSMTVDNNAKDVRDQNSAIKQDEFKNEEKNQERKELPKAEPEKPQDNKQDTVEKKEERREFNPKEAGIGQKEPTSAQKEAWRKNNLKKSEGDALQNKQEKLQDNKQDTVEQKEERKEFNPKEAGIGQKKPTSAQKEAWRKNNLKKSEGDALQNKQEKLQDNKQDTTTSSKANAQDVRDQNSASKQDEFKNEEKNQERKELPKAEPEKPQDNKQDTVEQKEERKEFNPKEAGIGQKKPTSAQKEAWRKNNLKKSEGDALQNKQEKLQDNKQDTTTSSKANAQDVRDQNSASKQDEFKNEEKNQERKELPKAEPEKPQDNKQDTLEKKEERKEFNPKEAGIGQKKPTSAQKEAWRKNNLKKSAIVNRKKNK